MRTKIINTCKSFGTLCQRHRYITSFTLIGVGAVFAPYVAHIHVMLAVYIIAIILPLVLGMMGKIGFKWVILWELIMFLPIGIILMVFFGGAIIGLLKR